MRLVVVVVAVLQDIQCGCNVLEEYRGEALGPELTMFIKERCAAKLTELKNALVVLFAEVHPNEAKDDPTKFEFGVVRALRRGDDNIKAEDWKVIRTKVASMKFVFQAFNNLNAELKAPALEKELRKYRMLPVQGQLSTVQ